MTDKSLFASGIVGFIIGALLFGLIGDSLGRRVQKQEDAALAAHSRKDSETAVAVKMLHSNLLEATPRYYPMENYWDMVERQSGPNLQPITQHAVFTNVLHVYIMGQWMLPQTGILLVPLDATDAAINQQVAAYCGGQFRPWYKEQRMVIAPMPVMKTVTNYGDTNIVYLKDKLVPASGAIKTVPEITNHSATGPSLAHELLDTNKPISLESNVPPAVVVPPGSKTN